ncbi:hypothetical protein MRX96_017001 [Rhipicephalus microplus]
MEHHDVSSIAAVPDVEHPPFRNHDSAPWFYQVESQFTRVKSASLCLPHQQKIRRLTPSEPERHQQLLCETGLGDRQQGLLLRQMQQLAGSTTDLDSHLVRELFLPSLPKRANRRHGHRRDGR